MSKRAYILRYMLIVRRLRERQYASFEELDDFIQKQITYYEDLDKDTFLGFSKRTLQRDIKEIRALFGIDIVYSPKYKGYFITHETEALNTRMLESFDILTSLRMAQKAAPFIQLDNRKPQGTEHLNGLLHAIENRLTIQFDHQKFWEDETELRTAHPYGLKEYRTRWYLICLDKKDHKIKTFGLDRIKHLAITNTKFVMPPESSLEGFLKHSFGVINSDDPTPPDILLSFTPFQGKYIKTLPLHESQEIIKDTAEELIVKLQIHSTHDFLMELLSFGKEVKVLSPQSLVEDVKSAHSKALARYDK